MSDAFKGAHAAMPGLTDALIETLFDQVRAYGVSVPGWEMRFIALNLTTPLYFASRAKERGLTISSLHLGQRSGMLKLMPLAGGGGVAWEIDVDIRDVEAASEALDALMAALGYVAPDGTRLRAPEEIARARFRRHVDVVMKHYDDGLIPVPRATAFIDMIEQFDRPEALATLVDPFGSKFLCRAEKLPEYERDNHAIAAAKHALAITSGAEFLKRLRERDPVLLEIMTKARENPPN